MDDSLTATLHRVLATHLRYVQAGEPIPRDVDLRELGLDSTAAIELLVDLEEALRMTIPDAALNERTFRTAATLEHALRALAGVPA
jgi:acyl carrier protein